MRTPTVIVALLVAVFVDCLAAQTTTIVPTDLRRIALRIVELETRRQERAGTAATIDSLLALYSDSVVYEHPNAGAVIRGKATMRRNMSAFLGSIRHVVATPPRVTIATGVAIVETSARMQILDGGNWVPVSRHGLRVIEFDRHGLVRRIIDYPW